MNSGLSLVAILRLGAGIAFTLCIGVASRAQTWERLGPDGGNVISLAAGPDGLLYLGAPDGHIFASRDSAAHWELRGRAGGRLDGVVQHLAVDFRSPQRVLAALWFQDPTAGGGVFLSDDEGRTWRSSGLKGEAVRAIEQSHSQPDTWVAGARSGIFRSNDSGLHWERISPAGDGELKNIDSLAIDPTDPHIIYAGTYHLPWKTTDGGNTWMPISAGMIDDSDVMMIHVDATNPARIFASACSGIYRSDNFGASWIKLQGIPYSSRRTQSLAQDPRDPRIVYAATTEGLWLTRDSGETWIRATPRDWVVNAVTIAESRSGTSKIILGTEAQGLLVTGDSAASFSLSNTGFSHRVVASLVSDPRNPQHLLADFPGSASPFRESRDAGKSWLPLPGQEPAAGIERLFATQSGWWASLVGGGAARYDEASTNWLSVNFVAVPSVHAHQNPAPRSVPTKSLAPARKPQLFDIQVSGSRVYLAALDGLWSGELAKPLVHRTISPGLAGFIRSLDVSSDGASLWAIVNERLMHSSDSAKTWSNETPAIAFGSMLWIRLLTPAQGSGLFLGTQMGVYRRSLDSNSPWQLLQSGLPAAATAPLMAIGQSIVIPAKNGGLYLSGDNGDTWLRLDTPQEESIFTGTVSDVVGGLILGSRTEGILHWIPVHP